MLAIKDAGILFRWGHQQQPLLFSRKKRTENSIVEGSEK
jgi:hypothetical protein